MKKVTFALLVLMLILSGSVTFSAEKPVIGITPGIAKNTIQLNYDYVSAIEENGGIALILPPTSDETIIKRYIEMVDGAVFSGGPDIPPEFYGQKAHHTTKVMEAIRFESDKRFIKAFLESGKPALGICLGMQFSNVLTGGTLIQDVPELVGTKISHRNGEMYTNFHSVGIARGSLLAEILGTTATRVISRHHQSVDRLGDLFQVVARSSDGIVEAIERRDGRFGIFVQWHPESHKDTDPDHRNRIFSALIQACQKTQ